MTQDYGTKTSTYFGGARTEIAPLLPTCTKRLLEIGCGAGQTVRWMRESGRLDRAWGVELFKAAAEKASAHFEAVIVGDAELVIDNVFDGLSFNLILCLDVLEHMVDPWKFLERVQKKLADGGKIIISVPNVRCARVLWPLLVHGDWKYAQDGILDKTHLRFFTKKTALELAATGDLRVDSCIGSVPRNTRLASLDRLTGGFARGFASVQFLIASSRKT